MASRPLKLEQSTMKFLQENEKKEPNSSLWVPITPQKQCSNLNFCLSNPTIDSGISSSGISSFATASTALPTNNCGISSFAATAAAAADTADNTYLDGLSCTQILRLAKIGTATIVEEDQFQVQPESTVTSDQKVIPGNRENVEFMPTHSKSKKRKVGADLNKKPGEKRQNKYYWAKIDVQKVQTPKPKTPKPVTPKPKTPKPLKKKERKINVQGPKILNHVLPEAKKGSSCTRALNFEDYRIDNVEVGELGVQHADVVKDISNVAGEINKDSYYKRVLNFEDYRTENVEARELGVQHADVVKDVSNVAGEIIEDSNYKPALNFEDCRIENVEARELGVQHADVHVSNMAGGKFASKSGQGSLRVYRRRFGGKCLTQCRKLGLNFLGKKKRSLRNKKQMEALFDRFSMMKGATRMLFPTKVKTSRESFKCVLRLLSSPLNLRRKKRLKNRLASTSNVAKQAVIPNMLYCSPPTQEFSRDRDSISEESFSQGLKPVYKECEIRSRQIHEKLSSSICSSSNSCLTTEVKMMEVKEKTSRRPYKRKDKRNDYLSKLDGWDVKSLEQIMDPFIQEFESLKLYDDPKKLERWSVMMTGQNNEGEAYEKSAKFKEETTILHVKILRFLTEMTKFQGRKEFVKWRGSVLDSIVGVYLTQNVSDVLSSNAYMELASRYPIISPSDQDEFNTGDLEFNNSQESVASNNMNNVIIDHREDEVVEKETTPSGGAGDQSSGKEYDAALNDMLTSLPYLQGYKGKENRGEGPEKTIDWDAIRVQFLGKNTERSHDTQDSVDWEAVRMAPVAHIADAINHRGQHRIIAAKIQKALNRLVDKHGTLDLEWLREAPHAVAKAYLLSFYGLGLKSVECLRLLTLHHHGFPVDVNIGRIAIRLGWVPIKPLPVGLPFHLLQKYPLESEIQQYLWPKLRNMSQELLYQIHYQMITFGKVFCLKKNPNCRACPFKDECKYYKSVVDSMKMKCPLLSWAKSKKSSKKNKNIPNPFDIKKQYSRPLLAWTSDLSLSASFPLLHYNPNLQLLKADYTTSQNSDPIIEFPASPKKDEETELPDIEDLFKDNVNEANEEYIFIKLGTQEDNVPPPTDDSSRALVSLSSEAASIPLPKHINPVRLRTEHQVYELPYNHLLLKDLDRQQGVIPYLLAIWTQGPFEKNATALEGCSGDIEKACSEKVPDDCHTVLGTILIPVKTAMRGSFPLNGTYFQLNEVFADDETSQHPISVPTSWIWMLPKRTLYCGSGTSSIFRGLTEEEIQRCCLEGYICTRGFNRKTRGPKPLPVKFHNRVQVKGKLQRDEEED